MGPMSSLNLPRTEAAQTENCLCVDIHMPYRRLTHSLSLSPGNSNPLPPHAKPRIIQPTRSGKSLVARARRSGLIAEEKGRG